MVRCSYYSLCLYKTLSKSSIIKTFEMNRRTLQRKLRILICYNKCVGLSDLIRKRRNVVGSETFSKTENVKVLSKHYLMKCVIIENCFFRYFRMNPGRFDHLLTLVREHIEKKDTTFRKSFPAAGRLAVTVRYLASGETQQTRLYKYCIGRSTISIVIAETC